MSRYVLLMIFLLALAMTGCNRQLTPEGPGTGTPGEFVPVVEESHGVEIGDIPPCSFEAFALDGYEAMVAEYLDLDMDGVEEFVIGYQYAATDELGEPLEPAYFTVAKWQGQYWEEWFGIPAPGSERYVDDASILAAGDINEDGIPELILLFYGFGVSSRPQNVYVWQVIDGGLEPAIQGGVIAMSSDDHISLDWVSAAHPGLEIIAAFAEMGDEAHSDAHRYRVEVWGWTARGYVAVDRRKAGRTYAGPEEAIITYVDAHRESDG